MISEYLKCQTLKLQRKPNRPDAIDHHYCRVLIFYSLTLSLLKEDEFGVDEISIHYRDARQLFETTWPKLRWWLPVYQQVIVGISVLYSVTTI